MCLLSIVVGLCLLPKQTAHKGIPPPVRAASRRPSAQQQDTSSTPRLKRGQVVVSSLSGLQLQCPSLAAHHSCPALSLRALSFPSFLFLRTVQYVLFFVCGVGFFSLSFLLFISPFLFSVRLPWYDLCGWLSVKNQLSIYLFSEGAPL